jgi:CBS domain-containing protein
MMPGAECIRESETLVDAAKRMRDLDVGALPICGDDDQIKGMVTDRDIVVKVIAEGGDPASTTAGSLGEGKPVTVGADDDVSVALETMKKYQVRRLPVIDGHALVGILSQADIAQALDPSEVGETLSEISEAN